MDTLISPVTGNRELEPVVGGRLVPGPRERRHRAAPPVSGRVPRQPAARSRQLRPGRVGGQAVGDAVVEALAGQDGPDVRATWVSGYGISASISAIVASVARHSAASSAATRSALAVSVTFLLRASGPGVGLQPAGRAHRRHLLAQRRVGPADRAGQLGDRHRAADVQPDDLQDPGRLEVVDAVLGVDAGDLVVHVGQQPVDRPPAALLGRVVPRRGTGTRARAHRSWSHPKRYDSTYISAVTLLGVRLLTDITPLRQHPAFRRLWLGTMLSRTGSAMTTLRGHAAGVRPDPVAGRGRRDRPRRADPAAADHPARRHPGRPGGPAAAGAGGDRRPGRGVGRAVRAGGLRRRRPVGAVRAGRGRVRARRGQRPGPADVHPPAGAQGAAGGGDGAEPDHLPGAC